MVKNLSYKYYVVQYAYQIFQIFSLLSLILTQISKQRRGTIDSIALEKAFEKKSIQGKKIVAKNKEYSSDPSRA